MRLIHAAARKLFVLRLVLLVLSSTEAYAGQRFSQIVLPFPEERNFSYSYIAAERALQIEFQKTNPDELEALNTYDEAVIRRVLIKDLGGQGSEVKIVLRDPNVRVMVNAFKEPFRITLDFFDADYKLATDPGTGLPMTPTAPTAAVETAGVPAFANNPGPSMSLSAKAGPPLALAGAGAETQAPVLAQGAQRRLLIPNGDAGIHTAQDLVGRLSDTAEGIGPSWKSFPPYIYRIQTAEMKTGKNYDSWMRKNADTALSSHEAMAQYAGQLFDFGHESRALIVYLKVLHENPSVFDKHADAIWKLAEIHLGQGNLSLANGYYEMLQSKHPDSPLAQLGALRRLDIRSIRASQQEKPEDLSALAAELPANPSRDNSALQAHTALRRAYWENPAPEIKKLLPDYERIPLVNPKVLANLEAARRSVDSPRTAFLIDSIILSQKIQNASWNANTAEFAGVYFEKYKGRATEPYRPALLQACEGSLLKSVDKSLQDKQFTEVISIIESLPKSMNELKNRANVSWAAGESYRRMQQPQAAYPYYETALARSTHKPDQFRAAFWLQQSLISSLGITSLRNQSAKTNLKSKLKDADDKTWNSWTTLNQGEKQLAFTELQNELEQNISESILVRSSPRILLEMLGQNLATNSATPDSSINAKAETAQPTVKSIKLLASLSRRFSQLGMMAESKKAKHLQRNINTKTLAGDKDSLKIWTDELTALAEEYRQSNDYLEAGRLFTLTGSSNNQWEGRAEALYKGGLLLYRSGRREEAVAAFKEAANDGNNQLYAELAKKRLEQLEQ